MLGHKLWQTFARRFDAYVTFQEHFDHYVRYGVFDHARSVGGVLVADVDSVVRAFAIARPEVVVNCIGIVKQDAKAKDPYSSTLVNGLFPHRLVRLCRAAGAQLIHISTDCVFSGRKGNYNESDLPDAEDLYGRTKLLGEVDDEICLTVRTSMIGRELRGSYGLVEWFLGQQGKQVRGFRRAIFSGLTTNALAGIIAEIIELKLPLQGVWNVAAEPINKYDLLLLLKQVYGVGIDIEPEGSFVCDRSLDGQRFRSATGIIAPSWREMITRMHQDLTDYDEIRRTRAER